MYRPQPTRLGHLVLKVRDIQRSVAGSPSSSTVSAICSRVTSASSIGKRACMIAAAASWFAATQA